MNLRDAAQQAIEVQNACNLSGVVRSFDKILFEVLWPIARLRNEGTEWVNTHPISVLFANKICDLTGQSVDGDQFFHAYGECEDLVNEPLEEDE